jgi:hypothetical protein
LTNPNLSPIIEVSRKEVMYNIEDLTEYEKNTIIWYALDRMASYHRDKNNLEILRTIRQLHRFYEDKMSDQFPGEETNFVNALDKAEDGIVE